MIYRVFDNYLKKYDIYSQFFIDGDGDLYEEYDGIEYKLIRLADKTRYSIEWGIELEGKRFFEKDVAKYTDVFGTSNIIRITKYVLFDEDLEFYNVIGTIHDEQFKYLER